VFESAINGAASQVNLGQFDSDGDGNVDLVTILHRYRKGGLSFTAGIVKLYAAACYMTPEAVGCKHRHGDSLSRQYAMKHMGIPQWLRRRVRWLRLVQQLLQEARLVPVQPSRHSEEDGMP
jgi:hypothetical protein